MQQKRVRARRQKQSVWAQGRKQVPTAGEGGGGKWSREVRCKAMTRRAEGKRQVVAPEVLRSRRLITSERSHTQGSVLKREHVLEKDAELKDDRVLKSRRLVHLGAEAPGEGRDNIRMGACGKGVGGALGRGAETKDSGTGGVQSHDLHGHDPRAWVPQEFDRGECGHDSRYDSLGRTGEGHHVDALAEPDTRWEQGFLALQAFLGTHGHPHPSVTDAINGSAVGEWAKEQRLRFKTKQLSRHVLCTCLCVYCLSFKVQHQAAVAACVTCMRVYVCQYVCVCECDTKAQVQGQATVATQAASPLRARF